MLEGFLGDLNPLSNGDAAEPAARGNEDVLRAPKASNSKRLQIEIDSRARGSTVRILPSGGGTVLFEGATPVRVSLAPNVYLLKHRVPGRPEKNLILTVSERHPRRLLLDAGGAKPAP
jgi:hypothetical protein